MLAVAVRVLARGALREAVTLDVVVAFDAREELLVVEAIGAAVEVRDVPAGTLAVALGVGAVKRRDVTAGTPVAVGAAVGAVG